MTEEIDGYAEDLERLVSTLRDGLDRLSRAKEDRKGNVRVCFSFSYLNSILYSKVFQELASEMTFVPENLPMSALCDDLPSFLGLDNCWTRKYTYERQSHLRLI